MNSIIKAMQMDGSADDHELFANIQARTREYASGAQLDWEASFGQQDTALLNTITMAVRNDFPSLRYYKNNWGAIAVLQQYFNNHRNHMRMKARKRGQDPEKRKPFKIRNGNAVSSDEAVTDSSEDPSDPEPCRTDKRRRIIKKGERDQLQSQTHSPSPSSSNADASKISRRQTVKAAQAMAVSAGKKSGGTTIATSATAEDEKRKARAARLRAELAALDAELGGGSGILVEETGDF